MAIRKGRRRLVLGVLNRLALYKKAREGDTMHGVAVRMEIDRKLLWRMRRVSAADK